MNPEFKELQKICRMMKLIADLRSLLHKPNFMPPPAIASPTTTLEFLVCSQARNLSELQGDVSAVV
jgi:hypothetical protein